MTAETEAASPAGVDVDRATLRALTPGDRETIIYTLREEADVARSRDDRVADAFEVLERVVRASGLVAGRCRICGCDEAHACEVQVGTEPARPCWWADDDETLCDSPACVERAAQIDRERGVAVRAVDEAMGEHGPGPFSPSSGLTRGGRDQSFGIFDPRDGLWVWPDPALVEGAMCAWGPESEAGAWSRVEATRIAELIDFPGRLEIRQLARAESMPVEHTEDMGP